MRLFLHLLALAALLIAPLAAPAAAMAAKLSSAECTNMAMETSGHEMPSGDHGQGDACCIAVQPAIDSPRTAVDAVAAIDHLAFVTRIATFHLGAGPNAEDPPPRPS